MRCRGVVTEQRTRDSVASGSGDPSRYAQSIFTNEFLLPQHIDDYYSGRNAENDSFPSTGRTHATHRRRVLPKVFLRGGGSLSDQPELGKPLSQYRRDRPSARARTEGQRLGRFRRAATTSEWAVEQPGIRNGGQPVGKPPSIGERVIRR